MMVHIFLQTRKEWGKQKSFSGATVAMMAAATEMISHVY